MQSQASLNEALATLVDHPDLSDVRFLAGEDAEPVYASRAILVSRSPVFAALLTGGFREGQPTTTTTATTKPAPSSTSSSTSSSSTSSLLSSPSAATQLWHNVEMPDVEPDVLRYLLHWCYTDTLHPDLVGPQEDEPAGANADRIVGIANSLVHLYAVADRFLLPLCTERIKEQLTERDMTHVALPLFDTAQRVAPNLAEFILHRLIAPQCGVLLSGLHSEPEEQWPALSADAARALISSEALCGISELYLFLAVARWAEHEHEQLAVDANEGEQGTTVADLAAPLLEHIRFDLISVNALARDVEPCGLLPPEKLLSVYRNAALFTSSALPNIRAVVGRGSVLVLDGIVGGRYLRWAVSLDSILQSSAVSFYLDVTSLTSGAPARGKVSLGGVRFYIYLGRRLVRRGVFTADHHLPVGGRTKLANLDASEFGEHAMCLTVRVLMPNQAFARPRQPTGATPTADTS